MARQTMMRGTVTVESLTATPWGHYPLLIWCGRTLKAVVLTVARWKDAR